MHEAPTPSAATDDLDADGEPLHSRTLSVTLRQAEPPLVHLEGYVLDLRKRGFAAVGGDLQGTGIIHHMRIEGAIDRATGTITQISADMPTVAFEPSEATGFESCRDLAARVDALAGTALDDQYGRRVGVEIGGPRGCSHVLTLAHLIGPTAAWAFACDAHDGEARERRLGERLFRRDVSIDGYELRTGELKLTLQMNDLHFAPAPALAPPMDRFARQLELRVAATLTLAELSVLSIAAAERRRTAADFGAAAWRSRTADVAPLCGLSLRAGITAALHNMFVERGDDRPLLDALLQLAPTTVQCFAAFADRWIRNGPDGRAARETGGLPDSCYMWRRDGAMIARRTRG